jgi:glycosyltransferase involved in cell wall biosynthesis
MSGGARLGGATGGGARTGGATGAPPARATVSVILLTHNEAHRIEPCLRSLDWVDEIVVVDSGSTDATLDLARRHGATIHTRALDDFAAQRNFAIDRARCDWILVVDADEEIPPGLRDEILTILGGQPAHAAWWVPRLNHLFGKPVRHGGQHPDLHLRLFRRGRGRYAGQVHERVIVDGTSGRLRTPLLHRSTATLDEWLRKLSRYTDLEARELHRRGRRAGVLHLVAAPAATFVRSYVVQLGFLDGSTGFVASALGAWYVLVKYLKLRELQARAEDAPPP